MAGFCDEQTEYLNFPGEGVTSLLRQFEPACGRVINAAKQVVNLFGESLQVFFGLIEAYSIRYLIFSLYTGHFAEVLKRRITMKTKTVDCFNTSQQLILASWLNAEGSRVDDLRFPPTPVNETDIYRLALKEIAIDPAPEGIVSCVWRRE